MKKKEIGLKNNFLKNLKIVLKGIISNLNILIIIFFTIFIILTLVLGGFILYDKVLSNENPDANNNSNIDNNITENKQWMGNLERETIV